MPKRPVTLEAMIRRASRTAEKIFAEDGEIEQTFICEIPNEPLRLIIAPLRASSPLEAHRVKARIAHKIRKKFAELGVTRYVGIFETWTIQADSEAKWRQEIEAHGYTLRNHPQRQERVYFVAGDGREILEAHRDIIRPDGGKAYLGKLSAIERPEQLSGLFVGLL